MADVVQLLIDAHQEMIDLLDGQVCDHSTGICFCQTFGLLDGLEDAVREMTSEPPLCVDCRVVHLTLCPLNELQGE